MTSLCVLVAPPPPSLPIARRPEWIPPWLPARGATEARRHWALAEAALLERNDSQARLLQAAANLQTNTQYLRNAVLAAAERGPQGFGQVGNRRLLTQTRPSLTHTLLWRKHALLNTQP